MYTWNFFGEESKTRLSLRRQVFSAVVAVLLIVAGAYWFTRSDRTSVSERVAQIIQEGDLDFCDRVEGEVAPGGASYATVCRNNIAMRLAREELDLARCDQLDGALVRRESCQAEVIQARVAKEKNIEFCNSISDVSMGSFCRERYWGFMAQEKDDAALCKNLNDARAQIMCADRVLLNRLVADPEHTRCDQFSKDYQGECAAFKKIVRSAQYSVANCASLTMTLLRRACESNAPTP